MQKSEDYLVDAMKDTADTQLAELRDLAAEDVNLLPLRLRNEGGLVLCGH